ncbi:hypothetical protein Avbf_01169 [Armadillidium vulgare]|nr:hypothetical protein Avbf_01169 [Armadillidium vulgare]
MEDFGAIEDDYITEDKISNIDNQIYQACQCEPTWFLKSIPKEINELINIKFAADYFYLKKDYVEAIKLYQTYLDDNINMSITCRRECFEGISRSYMFLRCYCHAYKYAMKHYNSASTMDTYTASLTLLYDVSLVTKMLRDSLIYAKKLVSLHILNSDIWLKLAFAYSRYYNILVLHIPSQFPQSLISLNSLCEAKNIPLPCECSNESETIVNEKSIIHVITSLLYAEYHLKSTMNSAIGFSFENNVKLQEKINKELDEYSLSDSIINNLRENIKQLFAGVKNDDYDSSDDFIDRASSKFTNAEVVKCILKDFDESEFDRKWFSFTCI